MYKDTSPASTDSLESCPSPGSLSEDSLTITSTTEALISPDSLVSVALDSLDPQSPDPEPGDSSTDCNFSKGSHAEQTTWWP